MLNAIIKFSIKNKLIVGLFTLTLITYGAYQVTKLPIDAVPDITNNQVQVITVAPSLGATDIERLVTFPIEQANNNIPGLHEIRSFSRFGLSLVTIVFDDDVDVYWARQQVAERLQKVQSVIPPGIAVPEMGPVTTGLGEIYQYVVRAKEGYEHLYSTTELRTIQDWIVRRQLLGVKGVADVSSFGGLLKQYEIAIKPEKLKELNVSISELYEAVSLNNSNTGGAYIEKGPSILYIRSEGLVASLEDIAAIKVKMLDNGSPVLVRDLADVRLGSAVRYGAMSYNDKGEVAGAVVMMLKGGNSNQIIKNVKERVAQIEKTLPEGVVIEPFLDRTKMVNNAIGTVEKNLLEGALIVIFILVLFLGNFRAGLIVASVIPLAMLFAIIMMNTFGVSGNLMSLGALDFGLIVDGAVIIVEAVMHSLTHNKHYAAINRLSVKEMDEEVTKSSSRMMNSAVFGQIIILIVYLPIFSLQGIEGKMFKPMAQTVAFALIGAFLLSLTYIPMMSSMFLSRNTQHKVNISDRMMSAIEKGFLKMLKVILHYKNATLAVVSVLFVAALIVLTQLGGEFIPALEEGDFALETRVLPGSNLNVSLKASKDASEILLKKFPEVEKIVAKIGSGEVPTDPMPIDAQDLMIILKDKSEWTSAKTFPELADKMGKELENVPGVSFGFQYPVQMRFNELMTGAKQDVVCKIFGENLDTLTKYASILGKLSAEVEGAEDVYVEPVAGIPQIIIEYNRAVIAQYGLNIDDVNKVVNTAFAGQSAGQVFEGERRFDLVLRLQDEGRKDLDDVRNLMVPTANGGTVPLYILANVEQKLGPNQIQREDAKRRIVVGFNVRGRDMASIVEELKTKVEKSIKLPTGYYVTYGGAFENLNAAKQRLSIAVPVALGLIYLMLFFAFNSLRQGLLIFTAIPLSAIGGVFALALRGLPFSISAGVGFIALFGVAVLNGIVLIAEFNRIRQGEVHFEDVVIKGTITRLRPVLMTAFVASLGFLPMALSHGAGAEVQRPLATVVIGGLLLATFLTLFVLPVLYLKFQKPAKMSNSSVKLMALLCLFAASASASAQTPIRLTEALDSSVKNNLALRSELLQTQYQQQLKKIAFAMPATNLYVENGQINSFYVDQRLGITQSFNFPTVYQRSKAWYDNLYQLSGAKFQLSEIELKRQVRLCFYQIVYLKEKENLLKKNDSFLSAFVKKTQLKYQLGDINILEKTGAENQRNRIAIQLQQLNNDRQLFTMRLQLLLNSTNEMVPVTDSLKYALQAIDSTYLTQHPQIKQMWRDYQASMSKLSLEKSKLLPDISLGYANMSMKGTGADNRFYSGSARFQSFQIGVGVPVFSGAQRAQIKATQTESEISKNNYQAGLQSMVYQWQFSIQQHQHYTNVLNFYENGGLNNARLMKDAADKQLEAGEINYLDWVIIIGQYISIESEYLDAVNTYNDNMIQMEFLMGK